ncbi:MAG: hypothetical protein R3C44_09515 [Chloroflexota bacterium]
MTIKGSLVTDLDDIDPPDEMAADVSWQFETAEPGPTTDILINEFDVDTPGTDTAEFIELYDGGIGGQSLNGLILVLFNGNKDTSYRTIDLDGAVTDSHGYPCWAARMLPMLTCRCPAVLTKMGPTPLPCMSTAPTSFPTARSLRYAGGLVDAVVYGTNDDDDRVSSNCSTPASRK